jgi:glycosyltransferase involved in cell wall biosynthesis
MQDRPKIKTVSVVIPVHNSAAELRLCLAALERQTCPRDAYEIIVVDNASTESLAAVRRDFPGVRWATESRPGSYAARNRGLALATGEIVAFTDADCRPHADWIEQGAAALATAGATLAGGHVELTGPADRPLNAYELIEMSTSALGNQRRTIETFGYAVTANLFTYRAVFARVGPFDATLRSSGDREWTQRAVRRGERLVYAANAAVDHPRRGSFCFHATKRRRLMGGCLALARRRSFGAALATLYRESFLNPRGYLTALTTLRQLPAMGWSGVLHFLFAHTALRACATVEGIRLLLGGTPERR